MSHYSQVTGFGQDSKTIMAEPIVIEKSIDPNIEEIASTTSPSPGDLPERKTTSSNRSSFNRRPPKRKAKPLAGDRFIKAASRTPLIVKAFLIVAISGLPFFAFLGLASGKYSDKVITTLDWKTNHTVASSNNTNSTDRSITLHGTNNSSTIATITILGNNTISTTTAVDNYATITYKQLALWLTVSWASFLVVFVLTQAFGRLSMWLCRLTIRGAKYAPLAQTMWVRVTMLAWIGTNFLSMCLIFPYSETPHIAKNWTYELRQAFEFLTIAFGIILAQGIALQLIAIQYIEGYVGPRSERASDELTVLRDLNNLIKPHIAADNPGIVTKMLHKVFALREYTIFDEILRGECDAEEVRAYAAIIWHTIVGSGDTLHLYDLTARLKAMGRCPDRGEELFWLLDESCDGNVTQEELERLVIQTAVMLKKRAAAMRGIQQLLRKLELLLTIFVFGTIVFVYTIFFPQDWAKDVKSLWTGIIALSFAFAAPVAEVVNSCVFVFAKHAYDVGDYVQAKGMKLMVRQIFLTHTNFEEVNGPQQRGRVVQISHSTLNSEVITNWTRSVDVLEETESEKEGAKQAA